MDCPQCHETLEEGAAQCPGCGWRCEPSAPVVIPAPPRVDQEEARAQAGSPEETDRSRVLAPRVSDRLLRSLGAILRRVEETESLREFAPRALRIEAALLDQGDRPQNAGKAWKNT